eukprot:COSAG01_NODE_59348_length_300_cov_5.985075_1_plen_43_part_10
MYPIASAAPARQEQSAQRLHKDTGVSQWKWGGNNNNNQFRSVR